MNAERYRLSFTTGGLFVDESVRVAERYLATLDWVVTRSQVRTENLLQVRTAAAALRISKEIVARLELLAPAELGCLVNGSQRERAYLLWAATCRRYAFIRDFANEVLREHFITLRHSLPLAEFDAFFYTKSTIHDELESTAESTRRKLRQNLFRMLREADLISDNYLIQPAMLTTRLAKLLSRHGRDALLVFPVSDMDIRRLLQ